MDPAGPQPPRGSHPDLGAVTIADVAEHLRRMREELIAMSARASNVEAGQDAETSERDELSQRAAELRDLIDPRLRFLEQSDALTTTAPLAAIPKSPAQRAAKGPKTWVVTLGVVLLVSMMVLWVLRSTPVYAPAITRVHAPIKASSTSQGRINAAPPAAAAQTRVPTHAPLARRRPDAPRGDPNDPATPRNTPVFELYSPQAPDDIAGHKEPLRNPPPDPNNPSIQRNSE